MGFERYFPNRQSVTRSRKMGFWGFAAVAVTSAAAVKIIKDMKEEDEWYDKFCKDEDEYVRKPSPQRPCDYALFQSTDIREVIKCRRKIMELMDLYECCDEEEILMVMGYEGEHDDLELSHKIFDSSTKFKVKKEGKMYVLYSQSPREVFEDDSEEDIDGQTGDEEIPEGSISEQDMA